MRGRCAPAMAGRRRCGPARAVGGWGRGGLLLNSETHRVGGWVDLAARAVRCLICPSRSLLVRVVPALSRVGWRGAGAGLSELVDPQGSAGFTRTPVGVLVIGMERAELEEAAFFDFMDARQAALDAAVGHFVVSNVPSSYLRVMVDDTPERDGATENLVVFAAQIVLHSRGLKWHRERHKNEPAGS